jgi:hypothetical protein
MEEQAIQANKMLSFINRDLPKKHSATAPVWDFWLTALNERCLPAEIILIVLICNIFLLLPWTL